MNKARQSIASRLRLARENAGLSQGQVAKLLGVHRPTVSQMEAGQRRVTAEELAQLAQLYGVSTDWLACVGSEGPDPLRDRAELAARELLKLRKEDLDRVLDLLASVRRAAEHGPGGT